MTWQHSRSERPTATAAGVLYILATVSGLAAAATNAPTELVPMAGERGAVLGSALAVTVMALACIGVAAVLHSVLTGDARTTLGRGMATGYLTTRIAEGTLFLVGVASTLAALTLSEDLAGTPAAGRAATAALGSASAAFQQYTMIAGQTAFAVGALLLSWLLVVSGRVPRWLAVWGLVGAPLFLVAGLRLPFTHDPNSAIATLLYAPLGVQELVLAVWLIARGFRPLHTPTPIQEGAQPWAPALAS